MRYAFPDPETGAAIVVKEAEAFILGEIGYPANWLSTATPEQIEDMGLRAVVELDLLPFGQRVTETGVAFDGGVPTAFRVMDPVPLAELAEQLQEAVRAKRWTVEIGGANVGGVEYRTDEKSQAKIAGLVQLFERDPEMEASDFEAQPGVWVSLDRDAADAIGVAIGRHVQACFTRSKDLSLAIAAALVADDRAAMLAAAADVETGWPS